MLTHAARSAIRRSLADFDLMHDLETRLKNEGEFKVGNTTFVRGSGKADKPGTVRAPGIRMQQSGSVHKQRWALS